MTALSQVVYTEPFSSSSSWLCIVQFLNSAGALEQQEDFTGKWIALNIIMHEKNGTLELLYPGYLAVTLVVCFVMCILCILCVIGQLKSTTPGSASRVAWCEATVLSILKPFFFPAWTHPNFVWKATGDQAKPDHQLFSNMAANTSTPRRMSILPRDLKSGSARGMSDKWFQLRLKGMVCSEKSHIILGMTIDVTSILSPE